MSVYVKGMEMPDDCRDCPFENYYNSYGITKCFATGKAIAVDWKCIPWDGRAEWCPLVEVKTPHGRLIDVKAMENLINEQGLVKRSWNICADVALNKTMTVIEAEDE